MPSARSEIPSVLPLNSRDIRRASLEIINVRKIELVMARIMLLKKAFGRSLYLKGKREVICNLYS